MAKAVAMAKPPQSDRALWLWVKKVLGIEIPRKQRCSNHASPFKAFADAYFARYPVIVWEASRGFGGKSFLLAALALTEQIALGASISLLGGSGEQAQRIHAYLAGEDPNAAGMFWEGSTDLKRLLKTDPTKRETRTVNGGYIKALMASGTSVRGPHPNRLRFDEIDEADLKILDASLGQSMTSRGIKAQTVLSSTHQYPDGTMTEVKKRSAEKGFPIYQWCYKETMNPHGWLDPEEVERKRLEIPKAMWKSEYELFEPSPEGRAIDADAVEALFDSSLGKYQGTEGKELMLIEPGLDEFYTGADWAKQQDYTVIHTMQKNENGPDRLAAWQRIRRRPWPTMIKAFNARINNYGGGAIHDATGVGDVVHDYLNVDSTGWDFRKRKDTQEMLSSYIAAIENGELKYPMIDYLYREHKYATVDQIYGSEHLPDTIAAGALAWHAKTAKKKVKRIGAWGR